MAIIEGVNFIGPPGPQGPQGDPGPAGADGAPGAAGAPGDADEWSVLNKGMTASVTTADGQLACATAVAESPDTGYIEVLVDGIAYSVGNGTKVGVACYFSGDSGVTARAFGAIVAGDFLYWNATVGLFQLSADDRIDFVYETLTGASGGDADIHTPLNKGMTASVTTSDGDLACATAVAGTPDGGWPEIFVNGMLTLLGNGTKVGVPCYFSADGGVTARAAGAVALGDLLYWNGSVALYQLAAIDKLDFVYETN